MSIPAMIAYARQKSAEMRRKMFDIELLLQAVEENPDLKYSWKTVDIDLSAASAEYLALLADAEVILAEFPKNPSDVPPSP